MNKIYWGWYIVAAACLITLLTTGMRLAIGPFFLPMTEDLGFSRSLLAGMIAIGMLCYGIGMPIAGYLTARINTRFVLLLGTTIVILSSVWTVLTRDAVGFFLAFSVLSSFGLAFTSQVAFTPVISQWFIQNRGMALFFLSTGGMAGIAIMNPIFTYFIQAAGWRATLLGFTLIFTLITVPAALWIVREKSTGNTVNPSALAPQSAKSAMCSRPFWQIVAGLFACGFSMNLLGTHGVPMLVDHGFSPMTGAYGISMIGLVAIFSTLVLGRISDKVQRRYLLATIYFVRGLGFFALVLVFSPWQLFTVAIIGGFVWAGSVALSSAILADVYGARLVGILYGWAYLGHQVGAMLSSWLGGWAYEQYGTHLITFWLAGALLFIAAFISLRLPHRKIA